MSELKEQTESLSAVLRCVIPPNEKQLERFRTFLQKTYHTENVTLDVVKDASLIGGFVLEVGSDEYDWSVRGRQRAFSETLDANLQKSGGKDVMSILKTTLDTYKRHAKSNKVGFVETCGDGIVTITGLDHAMYGEIVLFENGVKGMVQNIEEDGIGAILFDTEGSIGEGTKVVGTGRRAGVPVGDGYLGRVVNALGAPIDDGPTINSTEYRPIEEPAPGIVERKSVSVPLQTGILAIDSMFPIGRGQRELIIGDRQTGKTSIALDTILNQKEQNCICVYVAIGQKASTVAGIVKTLKEHDAMRYSIVVSSTAADPAPLQYIAPYAATSIAEYYMHSGRDVLIIYDDLSKHAVAYRAMSLLLGRSPGREAYPGDVFYLHSRLLERASRLSDELGGGSITALPIIETQDGDVSAYIPTNVISITDGQIFLESDLFFEGQRPAVNVGLSVSRVGGAAQTKAMKKAAGSLRIDLAQYREMEVFTQFSSDLDEATSNQLKQGRVLMELLKQPLEHPLSLPEEVITLCVAGHRKMMDVPVKDVKEVQGAMLDWFARVHPEIGQAIRQTGKLEDDMQETILTLSEHFLAEYQEKKIAEAEEKAKAAAAQDSNDNAAEKEISSKEAADGADTASQTDKGNE